FYLFQNSHHIFIEGQFRNLSFKKTIINISKIVGGAIGIYVASNILVNQTIVISDAMGIPTFIISIIILSLGTNLPEIMIAVNAILNKHSEIAFGDYIGSAAANPLLFGIFTVMNGPFIFEVGGINITFFILLFGYSLFYIFSRSKTRISPYEGIILIVVYVTFILFETSELFMLSPTI
ncbi:MAG TPA: hypothetical protein VJB65_02065, partial [Patescibacteria group bacterium]|nr:hypothetical protein [Patescibacteria group bacterium]